MSGLAPPAAGTDPGAVPPVPGREGLRHLARARRACTGSPRRPDAGAPGPVVILGAGPEALAVAPRLVSRGAAVTVIEDDPDTARRLTAHLARLALPVAVVSDDAPLPDAAVVLATGTSDLARARLARTQGRLRPDALAVLLADDAGVTGRGADGGATWARLRLVAPGSGLAELLGPAPAGLGPVLSALGCTPVTFPAGAEGAGARLMARHLATAEALIFAGVAPWDLDDAAEALGFATGPCALMDRLGVDRVLPRRARLAAAGVALPDPGVVARMVAEGRLGRRASVGWYRYPGGGGRVVDPLIEDLVREEAHFAGHPPCALAPARAVAHLVAALIDEAGRLLAEGSVRQAADIDLAAVLALGFPPRLGGPAFLAGRLGAPAARAAVAAMAEDLAGVPGAQPAVAAPDAWPAGWPGSGTV